MTSRRVAALGRTIARGRSGAPIFSSQRTTRDWKKRTSCLHRACCRYWRTGTAFFSAHASLPRHILINRTPVRRPTAHGGYAAAIGVSFAPYRIFNRGSFVAAFVDLGYRLVDEWLTPGAHCRIPDHALTFARRVPRILFRSRSGQASRSGRRGLSDERRPRSGAAGQNCET